MSAPVNATINVFANTDQAVAQFRSLQAQVATLNKSIAATSGAAVAQQAALNKALMDGANASRMWNARIVPMNTAVGQFSDALDKGRMSLGQYTRYAASQLPGMSRVFKREFDMMTRVAETNVKRMQTQYLALGNSAAGAAQAMAFTPTALDKQAAATQIAAQRQMMMNRMIDLGTTKLLNWGKNTQWAGRQLMVGFSIPLAMMGAAAAKAFKEIDQGTISFKRVYGDLQTTTAEMERNLDAIKELGVEYTKYGKSLASTIELSAKVAATGARNESLTAATEQTIRLATLGLMEYDEALEATVALQTAFQVSNEDLSATIDFLNVVENETILTMQDMAAAIPRVAPVVKGLGGDVKDLAVFMTALREGGVSAEQGANALKSGLGRLINPTKAAREEAEKYGISIEAIVQRNRGDLMGTVTEFGDALSALGQLEQQQVLQKVFGTYQYARLGALFRNLSNDAGQAQRTMELTSMSVEDLAKISERELSKIEEATSVKFQASIEKLKIAIAPIGETFMKALMPVIDFVSKILNAFNDLPDGVKNIIAIVVGVIAGLGPIVLMTVGLIANGIANMGKLVQTMRKFFARLRGDASAFDYLTKEEQDATAAANGLSGATDRLTGKFVGQQQALQTLITLVNRYAGALASTAAAMPLGMGVGSAGAMAGAMARTGRGTVVTGPRTGGTVVAGPGGMKMAKGGIVPGTGNKDTVPAMLTPGESVVTKEATQKYGPMIQAMNAGVKIPGFVQGVVNVAGASSGIPMQMFKSASAQTIGRMADKVVQELVEDGVAIDVALDKVTKVLNDFAATNQKLSTKRAKQLFEEQNLTRTSRTLVAAHLTSPMPYSDPRTQAAIAQQSAAFQAFARANPDYVRATSKLTALLPGLLNQQMAPGRGGATFKDFRSGWKMGGKDTLLNAASLTDDTIKGDAEAGKALRKMAGDIGRRAIQVAKAAGEQRVKDEHLATATQQIVDKYKALGGASTRAATALDRAANQVGQLRVNVPSSAVRSGLASGEYVQRGRSVLTRSGVEVARDGGARAAGNIPVAGGLATATARQQAEVLAKVMASNGPVVAASYYATNTPAMVAGAAKTAQQMAQTQNKILESNTQDIAMLARDRNSPHPVVAQDAVEDARSYATKIKQTLMSMTPVKLPGGMIQASPPNLPQGTQFRAPGGGVAQVYNPSNNPRNLGIPGAAIPVAPRPPMAAIESREGVYKRQQAEERRLQQEQDKLRVVDNRRTSAVREQIPVIGQQTSWIEKSIQSQQQLERQKQLNLVAQEQAAQSQQRLNGAMQREAVLRETMNQKPARGGMLDRPLGALRRLAFPGGQDASLKNLGFNQFSGQVKTAGQLLIEAAQGIKTRVTTTIKSMATDFKASSQQLLTQAKLAGSALKTDFKNLGGMIKTNMQVDLNTVKTSLTDAAGAVKRFAAATGAAAQRMAGSVGGFLTAVDKNGVTRMQKMGQAGNGAMMGLMGLSMAASFAGGSIGEMAQKIMPITMGLMGLQMILPMLTNPLGIAIIAAGALAAAFIYMRKTVDDAAKSAAKLAAEQGGAANRMESTEEALQYQFARDRVGERGFRFTEEDREAQSEFTSYFESEGGQKFIQELKGLTSEARYAKIASQISFAIADGLDPEKAKAFAQGIAAQIGDSLLNSRIVALFASGELRSGSEAMTQLIEERQAAASGQPIVSADLRGELGVGGRALRLAEKPVTESVHYLTRGLADLAGTANTTTDVFGKAAFTIGSTAGVMAAAGAPIAGVGAAVGAVVGTIAGALMAVPVMFEELDQMEKNAASVAAAFGSTIQILKEVDNAEALLLEERRKGIITAEEYAEKEAELNKIKNTQAEILSKGITALIDQGANEQAIVDQLVLGGFDEATAGAVARATNKDTVAAQLFDGQSYEEIGVEGQKFVDTVIADLLTGLTPENAQTKIAEIGTLYKGVAQSIIDGAVDGMTLGNIDLSSLQGLAEEERYASATRSLLPDNLKEEGKFGRSLDPETISKTTAKNFIELEDVFLDLEVTGQDVFNTLASFGDPLLIAKIGQSKEELERLGKAVSLLGDYPEINIEMIMDQNIDPQEVLNGLNEINNFKFNKKAFGDNSKEIQRTAMSGQQFISILQETNQLAGKTGKEIGSAYGEALTSYDKLIDSVETNKLGNLVISTDLVTKLFGREMENGKEIAQTLKDALPDGLGTMQAQIMLSVMADPTSPLAQLFLNNPNLLAAMVKGGAGGVVSETTYASSQGVAVVQKTAGQLLESIGIPAAWAETFKGGGVAADVPTGRDEDTGPSGGSKEKTALEELEESIAQRAALYLSVTKKGQKLNKSRKGYLNQLAAETTTNNSIAAQLRKLNLSETLVADILAMGAEKANEIIQQLGPNGLRRRNVADIASRAGLFINTQRGVVNRGQYRETARTRLQQTGRFSEEEIETILEDEEATEIIATLPKKFQKLWKELVAWLRKSADATAEVVDEAEQAEKAFDAASDRFEKLNDMMMQGFDAAELEAADKVASKFFTDNSKLAAGLAKSTGHTIENGYQLAEAMERQVSLNERLIDQEQDKIDKKQEEINDYERTNALIQQGIDDLRKQDETRNRRSESLSRDLEQIAEAEEKIRKSYEERIKTLDKVASINDYLIQQQQKQLNLSRAISEGDIYAATQAAQEMRAASAQRAAEQTRLGLEAGMEAEMGNLTNAEGMTRVQIEEEINNIKEQNYQNSLLIRIEEDKIYKNNLEIRRLSNEIYNIQEDIIEPLTNQNKEYTRMLDYYKEDEAYQISRILLAGMTRDQFERQADALGLSIKNARDLDPELLTLVGRYEDIAAAARAAAASASALGTDIAADQYTGSVVGQPSTSGMNFSGGMGLDFSGLDFSGLDFSNIDFSNMDLTGIGGIFLNSGGQVGGTGSRDSVPAMLTPGEYVIRKAMVGKYGIPLMEALNQGSFAMPRYETGPQMPEVGAVSNTMVSSINAPVYNTYDMKFSINGTNQSTDEIANKVMFKIKQIQGQGIRSNRGY